MKTALITTTINVPAVLELYRQHGPDVMFFVAGDRKTPDEDVVKLLERLGNHCYLGIDRQHEMFKCSRLIPENCIQRRNLALLAAVQWGADVIVSIDDDNIPLSQSRKRYQPGLSYFDYFSSVLTHAHGLVWSGIEVSGQNGWFDVGRLLDPVAKHRGFPIAHRQDLWRAEHTVGARVGAAAGICLGDPDIDAVTRIERAPEVHRVSQLLESGIIVDNKTWTVFNSQNTAFIRELAPAFFMLPGVGRYDDIYASLIMQRVMRERGLHVHFGKPFVWQERNQHNLIKDLGGEIDGMENIERFARILDGVSLEKDAPVTAHVSQCWMEINNEMTGFQPRTIDCAAAFLEDMLEVL